MKEKTLAWRWKKERELFLDFLKKTRWMILLASAILLFTYIQWLKAPILHVDPEILILDPASRFGGGHAGRPGLTLANMLLGLTKFNPDLMSAFGWLALCVAGVMVGYTLYRCGLRDPYVCAALGPLMFISAAVASQFYWYQRLISTSVAYVLCGAAAALSWFGLMKKKWLPCLLSVPLLAWAFSIYQSMPFVYIALAITAYLLLYRRLALTDEKAAPGFAAVVGQVLIFAAAYLLYALPANVFLIDAHQKEVFREMTSYWGRQPLFQCLRSVLGYVKSGLLGNGTVPYTTWIYGALSVLAFLAALWECWNAKGKKGRWLYVLAVAALQSCPFLVAVYCGGAPLAHSQLVYPVVMACNILFLAGLRPAKRPAASRLVAAALAVVLIWSQSGVVMRLLYTDHTTGEEDLRVMEEIAFRIHQIDPANKPVALVGEYAQKLNPACRSLEYIGWSVLNWGAADAPHYMVRTARMERFYQSLGMDITTVADESGMLAARRAALDMPVWPAPGSVKETENCVVVKLSEDRWPEEVVEPALTSMGALELPYGDAARVTVESAAVEDGRLTVRGVVRQSDMRYSSWRPHLYLLSGETGEMFELASAKYGRPGLMVDGQDAANSCFVAMAPADAVEALGDYTVLFGYEDTVSGQTSLCDTSISLGAALGGHAAGLPGADQTEKTDRPGDIGFYRTNARLEGSELVSDGTTAGTILWGPYSETVPGVYDITLNYVVESVSDAAEGTFDVALDTQRYAAVSFTAGQTSATLEDVSIEAGHKFEARVSVPAGMVIRVQSIHYTRVG